MRSTYHIVELRAEPVVHGRHGGGSSASACSFCCTSIGRAGSWSVPVCVWGRAASGTEAAADTSRAAATITHSDDWCVADDRPTHPSKPSKAPAAHTQAKEVVVPRCDGRGRVFNGVVASWQAEMLPALLLPKPQGARCFPKSSPTTAQLTASPLLLVALWMAPRYAPGTHPRPCPRSMHPQAALSTGNQPSPAAL